MAKESKEEKIGPAGRGDFEPAAAPPRGEDIPMQQQLLKVVVRNGPALIGQQTFEEGSLLAEVRLATGLTLPQFCAALSQQKAGVA